MVHVHFIIRHYNAYYFVHLRQHIQLTHHPESFYLVGLSIAAILMAGAE